MRAKLLILGLAVMVFVGIAAGSSSAGLVPSCVGEAEAQCVSELQAVGLVASTSYEYDSAPEGSVFAQIPSAGAELPAGSSVHISISYGTASPEVYAYEGLLYGLCGIVSVLLFGLGIRVGLMAVYLVILLNPWPVLALNVYGVKSFGAGTVINYSSGVAVSSVEAWALTGVYPSWGAAGSSAVVATGVETAVAGEVTSAVIGAGGTAARFGSAALGTASRALPYIGAAMLVYDGWKLAGCPGREGGCTSNPAKPLPEVSNGLPAGPGRWIEPSLWATDGVGSVPSGASATMGTNASPCTGSCGASGSSLVAFGWGAGWGSCWSAMWNSKNGSCWDSDGNHGAPNGVCYYWRSGCGGAAAEQAVISAIKNKTDLGVFRSMTLDELKAALQAGINANNDQAVKVAVAAINALNEIQKNNALDTEALRQSYKDLVNSLINNLTAAQKAYLDSLLTPTPGTNPTPYTPSPDTGKSLTPEQIKEAAKEAVKEAMNDQAQGVGVPSAPAALTAEAEPPTPEKSKISDALDYMYDGVKGLPIVSFFTSMSLQASGGSPTISVPIPQFCGLGGGTATINFSSDGILGVNYGYWLGLIGNILLAGTGIKYTIYLFKAGEA